MSHTIKVVSEIQRRAAVEEVMKIPLEPVHSVTIKLYKSKRSLDQNALYWKWLTCIKDHVLETSGQAFSEDELHIYYRKKFLPYSKKMLGKTEIEVLTSTTKLNTKEMSEYMSKIDLFCVEKLHLFLPQPDTPDIL